MKYCKYCGCQIDDTQEICQACSERKSSTPKKKISFRQALKWFKKHWLIVAGVLLLVALITAIAVVMEKNNCNYSSCNNKTVSGSDYCYSHKCSISSCTSAQKYNSNYCYLHSYLYETETGSSYSNYVSSSDLKISVGSITHNSSYTVVTGTITNNSDSEVRFVEIKGAFKTSGGTVVDTDWTYAVGSEGLAPGESCKWRMSVDKDYSIKQCSVSIIDFDY